MLWANIGWAALTAARPNALFLQEWKPRRPVLRTFVMAVMALLIVQAIVVRIILWNATPSSLPTIKIVAESVYAHTPPVTMMASMLMLSGLLVLDYLIHKRFPHRCMIEEDFIRALTVAGVIAPDLRADCFGWHIKVNRQDGAAIISFWLRYPSRSYEDMLPMVEGLNTAFRFSSSVVPDRAKYPYAMSLVVRYGNGDDDNER